MTAVITASGALILSTVYISQKFLDQFIKEEGYGRLRRFFFPKKKYQNRLSQIISSTIKEYKNQTNHPPLQENRFYFYQSEVLIEKLSSYILYRTNYTEGEINILFDSHPNIIKPKKLETDLFLKLFIKNILKDQELKKLHILERYQEEIFNISADVKAVKENLEEVAEKVENITKDKIGTKQKNNLTKDLLKLFIDTDKRGFVDLNRTFENFESDDLYLFSDEKDFYISEIIKNNSKVALIGNPGSGKSTEILNLAYSLWENNSIDLIPVFRRMHNFTISDSLTDYLNFNLISEFSNLILILDGIDEIVDGNDFISKLQTFIREQSLAGREYKYLISCRSNIFSNFSSQLQEFEVYKLSELRLLQSQKLLESLTSNTFDIAELYVYSEKTVFLKYPFLLKIVANYYNTNGYLETNSTMLWETYILDRIENDRTDKFQKKTISTAVLKKNSKKTALTFELMQKSTFNEDSLLKIIQNDKELSDFRNSALIEFNPSNKVYFFEHKNIQEYFSAKALEELSFDLIKEIICINGTDSIHPSYINTSTFLLNLIPVENPDYEKLIRWFVSHNPEILFRADSDRISELRTTVFQKYFNQNCLETTVWISQNPNLSISDIAQFSDHIDNYKFLLTYIIDLKIHFRVRISAMELIRKFKQLDSTELLNEFFTILKSEEESLNIKSETIRSIRGIEYHKRDLTIIPKIIDLFRSETDRSINNQILRLIDDSSQIDESIDFILREFDFAYKIIPRSNQEDNVILGNDWTIKELLMKLNEPLNFISLSSKLLLNSRRDFSEDYPERFIQKIKELKVHQPKIVIDLIDSVIHESNSSLFDSRDFLANLVIKLNVQQEVFEHLLNKDTFINLKWFLAKISTTETIEYFIQNWKICFKNNSSEIEGFRNIVNSYHKYDLSGILQEGLLKQNFIFKDLIPNQQAAEKEEQEKQKNAQDGFNQIFDPKRMLESVDSFFKELKIDSLNKEEVYKLERDFFEIPKNYFKRLPISIQLLHFFARKDNVQTIKTIESRIENLEQYIFFIDSEMSHAISDRNFLKTEINDSQKTIFCDWLNKLSEGIDFQNLIEYTSYNSFRFSNSEAKTKYNIQQIIIKYYNNKNFEVQLSSDFLLNSIEYFDIENYAQNDHKFNSFLDSISDQQLVKEKVVENLNKQLFPSVYNRHAKYALNKGFNETYHLIENVLLSDNSIHSENDLLLLFIQKNGKNILKTMINDISTRSCWTAIDLLMKLEPTYEEKELCLVKAKEYLDTNEKDYKVNALKVLVSMNDPSAINFLCTDLTKNLILIGSVNQNDYKNYNKVIDKNLLFIKDLFYFIYKKDVQTDEFRFHYLSEFFYSYLYNLSKDDTYYAKLVTILTEIRDSLSQMDDHELFYINSIINNCSKSYIASKSIPMNFKEALAKVNELMS